MYEIGDDVLVLGSEKDRLALVENRELLNIPKIGRASTPLDLMTYEPEDGQPSVFILHEDQRQAILTVFNWTGTSVRSHTLSLADLGLGRQPQVCGDGCVDPERDDYARGWPRYGSRTRPAQSVRIISASTRALRQPLQL